MFLEDFWPMFGGVALKIPHQNKTCISPYSQVPHWRLHGDYKLANSTWQEFGKSDSLFFKSETLGDWVVVI